MPSTYRIDELWRSMHRHYPDQAKPGKMLDQGAYRLLQNALAVPTADRFARPTQRGWAAQIDGWLFPLDREKRPAALLALTYRGLVNLKSPFDLALYPRLIWELQPRTIVELGSFHGGSGLWFADQLDVLCKRRGEVHSFDLHGKVVSTRARHPRLHFHRVDLTDLASFDAKLLTALPHPWLVVDDAHVNVLGVLRFLDGFMQRNDYYVIEDVFMNANTEALQAARILEDLGYLIDTHFTDAFGYNVTCAPNGWLRKS